MAIIFTYFTIAIGVVMFISFISMIALAYLNNKRFLEVCRLYELEFGSLPLSATILKNADIIGFSAGYSTKIEFIILPLIFGKKSMHSKNNDVEFMRQLPNNIKRWFVAEYYCAVLGCATCVIIGICMYLDKNH
ncbi:hypothetical protein [Rahnella selenatireducens]|uniref:hypothetical protein n=1 Tax=Rahnella selenatireducens TaxID=3389797 RepID=UPI003969A1AB